MPSLRDELGRDGRGELGGFVSCFVSKNYMNIKPKYFLYARKSTEDDDRQVMSIEAQLFELRELARKENLEILEEFQESKSAKTPGREVFSDMFAKIEKLDGVGILAWHPDRLARNSIDGGRVIYAVDTRKVVSLRFPTFWFEPTPQGLFMSQLFLRNCLKPCRKYCKRKKGRAKGKSSTIFLSLDFFDAPNVAV